MALCVVMNADGSLSPTGEPVASCSGYVLLSGSEYSMVGAIDQALGVPDSTQAMGWFVGPFSLVVGLYIVARMAGAPIQVFKR